jgi:hypothetical protein
MLEGMGHKKQRAIGDESDEDEYEEEEKTGAMDPNDPSKPAERKKKKKKKKEVEPPIEETHKLTKRVTQQKKIPRPAKSCWDYIL